jgi:carboxypeptidase T
MQRFLFACALTLTSAAVSVSARAVEPTGRYKTIVDQMQALQARYPALSHIFSIGQNDDGVDIFAMRISRSPQVLDGFKVGHLMVSTHHGNESAAPVFTMKFIADLLSRYGTDQNLDDKEFTIVPVLNVSGYNANQRHEKGRDPNRDYANPCTLEPGGKLKSISLAINLAKSRIFSGSVTVHGYDGSLTYPWGLYADNYKTQDDNQYQQIFSKAAQLNGYRVGTAAEVVYPANGCYEDYVYWKHGMWSLLLELASGSDSDINGTVKAIASFYDQLNSSPSDKSQFLGKCTSHRGPDLRVE